ncbi:MAG: hypothetical protein OHK0039_04120 [Bacteroidia bacterium]
MPRLSDRETRRRQLIGLFGSNPRPHFVFPRMQASATLSYEPLDDLNEGAVYDMFHDDPSPFVQADFKDRHALSEYVDALMYYHRYSPKRGGQDWLLRHREAGCYVGLIHLYDLSRETFADAHRKCTIGFALRADYRGRGLGAESAQHLLDYIRAHFDMIVVRSYTDHRNIPAQRLLESLGFAAVRGYDARYSFYEKTL